jgi:glucose-1-phosphate thymidylyltransferase
MSIIGVIPAAGHATRLQPLRCSKEVLPIDGKPVMDFLVDRMRAAGCTELRVVTRREKADVIAHAGDLGATVVVAEPETVSRSILAGAAGVRAEDVVLLGFPDTIWEPLEGFVPLVQAVADGCEAALGLFRIAPSDLTRSDVIVFDGDGGVAGIDVKPRVPRSGWIWGCAAVRAETLAELARADWPGGFFDLLAREGRDVRAIRLSDVWLDIGTRDSLRVAAERFGSVET